MARSQTFQIGDLAGGMNTLDAPNKIQGRESPFLRNARVENNSTRNRPGYSQIGDTQASVTQINGIADLGDNLIINHNAGLHRINPETETALTTITNTITSDTVMNFSRIHDALYCFNGVDKPGKLVGTTYTEPFTPPTGLIAATFLPKFGDFFQGSLMVAGVPSKLNIAYASKAGTISDATLVENFAGGLSAGGDAFAIFMDDEITAIKARFDSVVIFTKTGATLVNGFKDLGATIVPTTKVLEGGHGCVGHQAAVLVEDDIYYLTPKNEVRSVLTDINVSGVTQTSSLSDEIKSFMNDELDNDQSGAVAYYDRVNKLFKLWVKSKGATFNDICLVRDLLHRIPGLNRPTWFIDTAKNISAAHHFKNRNFIGSAIEGRIFEDEIGLADDGDAPIPYEFRTKEYDLGSPTTQKKWKNVEFYGRITINTSFTAQVFVDGVAASPVVTVDKDDITANISAGIGVQEVGSFAVGDDSLVTVDLRDYVKRIPIRKTGKKIQIVFLNQESNQHLNISGLRIRFIPQGRFEIPKSEIL